MFWFKFESGNEIPTEIIHALLRMAPTADEELKLRLFTGDINHLGPAERFLKVLVEIPFAFKRLESLMFINTLSEEFSSLKDSFGTLEVRVRFLLHSLFNSNPFHVLYSSLYRTSILKVYLVGVNLITLKNQKTENLYAYCLLHLIGRLLATSSEKAGYS